MKADSVQLVSAHVMRSTLERLLLSLIAAEGEGLVLPFDVRERMSRAALALLAVSELSTRPTEAQVCEAVS